MDRQAQLKRLVWLSTTDLQARKAYAWQVAKELDADYPGISAELVKTMNGQAASLGSESHSQQKPR